MAEVIEVVAAELVVKETHKHFVTLTINGKDHLLNRGDTVTIMVDRPVAAAVKSLEKVVG